MIKRICSKYVFIGLLFTMLACSKDDSKPLDPVSPPIEKITNGPLPDLGRDYVPLNLSNKIITSKNLSYVPMDFESQILELSFDVSAKTASGSAYILFQVKNPGRPYLQLPGSIKSVSINGTSVATGIVTDPDGLKISYTSLEKDLIENKKYLLEIEFTPPSSNFSFDNGGVGFLTSMTDLAPAHFFEHWGPGNFEEDSFALTLDLNIKNSTSKHQVFCQWSGDRSERQGVDGEFPFSL